MAASGLPPSAGPPPSSSTPQSFAAAVRRNSISGDFNVVGKLSTFEGIPSITFESQDLSRAAFAFRFALILKFSFSRRPSVEVIRSAIKQRWGLSSEITVSLLDSRHVLLQIPSEGDMVKVLSRETTKIEGVSYKVFRWTPNFDPKQEATKAPIWVQLKGLPVHMFSNSFLSNIAKPIGKFLRSDNSTEKLTNTTRARFFVEVDLSKPLPESISINPTAAERRIQIVTYEEVPLFCAHCSLQGHDEKNCRKLIGRSSIKNASNPALVIVGEGEKEKEGRDDLVQKEFVIIEEEKEDENVANKVFDEMPEPRNEEILRKEKDVSDLEKQVDDPIGPLSGCNTAIIPNCNAFEILAENEEGEIVRDEEDEAPTLPEPQEMVSVLCSQENVPETALEYQRDGELILAIVEDSQDEENAPNSHVETGSALDIMHDEIVRNEDGIEICVDFTTFSLEQFPPLPANMSKEHNSDLDGLLSEIDDARRQIAKKKVVAKGNKK